MLKVLLNPSQS